MCHSRCPSTFRRPCKEGLSWKTASRFSFEICQRSFIELMSCMFLSAFFETLKHDLTCQNHHWLSSLGARQISATSNPSHHSLTAWIRLRRLRTCIAKKKHALKLQESRVCHYRLRALHLESNKLHHQPSFVSEKLAESKYQKDEACLAWSLIAQLICKKRMWKKESHLRAGTTMQKPERCCCMNIAWKLHDHAAFHRPWFLCHPCQL